MDSSPDTHTPQVPSGTPEAEDLHQAFKSFVESSQVLEQQYDDLQTRIDELHFELEEKNRLLESNLREKEAFKNYLSRILESLTTGVVVSDDEGGIRIHNSACCRVTGLDERWMEHLSIDDFLESWITDSKELQKAKNACSLDEDFVVALDRKPGGSKRVEISRTRLLDADGSESGWIYLLRDVTRQVRLQAEAERTDRLTAMGEMAINIVHEVRNPLGGIELFASLLKKDLKGDDDKVRLVENITGGVRSLDHIISNLLSFTRNRQPVCVDVTLKKLVDESLRFTDHLFRQSDVTLVLDYQTEDDEIHVDPELMKQVLMNLILNGVQAMEEQGGILRVCVENDNAPGQEENGQYLCIRVSDTGHGMTSNVCRRVFNPFFTTKDRGTGLGLALVHNIVQAHNGHVEAKSELGKGTEFTILLPRKTMVR